MKDSRLQKQLDSSDEYWSPLRSFTAARIALGRTGVSVPLKENLQFRLAHAYARDAVYASLSEEEIINSLKEINLQFILLNSQCSNRNQYLQRPDLGRKLTEDSSNQLKGIAKDKRNFDIAIAIADGLSAIAIHEHILPVLQLLVPKLLEKKYSIAPISIVKQARVAIADEIGSLLLAKMSIIFIGERPGLTSPNSMGTYITYNPIPGLTDERRNCISNIRPEGLAYEMAVDKILYLINQSFRMKISGVDLKDNTKTLSDK